MSRKLYAWAKDDKFFLSAFAPHLDPRPAKEFDSKDALTMEVARRGGAGAIDIHWEEPGGD